MLISVLSVFCVSHIILNFFLCDVLFMLHKLNDVGTIINPIFKILTFKNKDVK